jgi:jasmonate ZIM domain-containing protein
MACSLLSRYVRQNGTAAGDLGLAVRGELSSLVEEKLRS